MRTASGRVASASYVSAHEGQLPVGPAEHRPRRRSPSSLSSLKPYDALSGRSSPVREDDAMSEHHVRPARPHLKLTEDGRPRARGAHLRAPGQPVHPAAAPGVGRVRRPLSGCRTRRSTTPGSPCRGLFRPPQSAADRRDRLRDRRVDRRAGRGAPRPRTWSPSRCGAPASPTRCWPGRGRGWATCAWPERRRRLVDGAPGRAEDTLAALWTFFPDPWHKKKPPQAPAGHASLRRPWPRAGWPPGAEWRLATDWGDYADQMIEVLDAEPQLQGGSSSAGTSAPSRSSSGRVSQPAARSPTWHTAAVSGRVGVRRQPGPVAAGTPAAAARRPARSPRGSPVSVSGRSTARHASQQHVVVRRQGAGPSRHRRRRAGSRGRRGAAAAGRGRSGPAAGSAATRARAGSGAAGGHAGPRTRSPRPGGSRSCTAR